MNCKPGELAVFVRSMSGNEGKIVRCLRIKSDWDGLMKRDGSIEPGVVWEIDPPVPAWSGNGTAYALDSYLRPIRDPGEDAIDETLGWIPVPGVKVDA
jgi:hypothetical protein